MISKRILIVFMSHIKRLLLHLPRRTASNLPLVYPPPTPPPKKKKKIDKTIMIIMNTRQWLQLTTRIFFNAIVTILSAIGLNLNTPKIPDLGCNANSAVLLQTPQNAASDQGQYCLLAKYNKNENIHNEPQKLKRDSSK